MRHLVLVRHGESELNAISRHTRTYCGQIETPLTEHGRQQAYDAGHKLAQWQHLQPRSAVSSPLQRAQQTLGLLLSRLDAKVNVLPPVAGLMERSHGAFEGLTEEVVFRDYPHYRDHPDYCHFMNHFWQSAPQGESLAAVSERAWLAVQRLTEVTDGDLIIVSHFNPIRCVLGQALRLSQKQTLQLHIPNAEPIVLGWNGSFSLLEPLELCATA